MSKILAPKEGPHCPDCPLFRTGIVIMDRLPVTEFSGLSVIGEMSGMVEVKERSVFVGPTGKLFRAICDAVGIPIDTLHITNCIACGMEKGGRPSDGDAKKILACCKPLLIHNMKALGTKVACATGAVPWEALSGLKGINKYRGCVLPSENAAEPWTLTATLHPAGLLQNEATRIGVENVRYDVRKAYDLAIGARDLWEPDVRDAKDVNDLLDFLETALEEDWAIAVDVETDGIDPWSCNLTTVGVAGAPNEHEEPEAWSIPWGPAFGGFYAEGEWEQVLQALKALHRKVDQTIVYHNFAYDVPVLRRHLEIEITASIQDTLLLDHAAFPKLPHNLQNLASRYLAVEPWKDDFRASEQALLKQVEKEKQELDNWFNLDDDSDDIEEIYAGAVHISQLTEQGVGELLWYNAVDTAATWKLYWILLKEVRELNTYNVYLEDLELAKEALNWTETGILIDMAECERLDAEYSMDLIERKGRLREMCGLPDPAEINEQIDLLDMLIDNTQADLTEARKVCFVCGKNCGSTKKVLEHAKTEHEGHDQVWNAEVIKENLAILKQAREELKVLRKTPTVATFNPASPPQLRKVLALRGLTPTKVTKKSLEVSTSKESLWDLRDDVFVDELFRWRSLAKLHSTYIKNMASKLGPDGRLHPAWKLYATPSGRFGTAPAVQNWPKEMKALMIPEAGNRIVGADYKALELRIIALLSGQEDLIDAFLNDTDIHARHAGWFFPKTFPGITEQWLASGSTDDERDAKVPEYGALRGAGKPVTFGKNYRAGPQTLYETIRAQREDIKTVQQQRELLRQVTMMSHILDTKYSNIVDWSDAMNVRANAEFYLKTEVVGRIRKWPMGEVPPTESANHPVQGMAADVMNRATMRLVHRLKQEGLYHNGVWIILQIHDALYLECWEEVAEQAARILEECLRCEYEVVSPVTGKKNKMFFDAKAKIATNVKGAA